jgi:hypothetical protein
MFPLNTIIAWSINIIMNKKYDNNNIIIASRAYFLHFGAGCFVKFSALFILFGCKYLLSSGLVFYSRLLGESLEAFFELDFFAWPFGRMFSFWLIAHGYSSCDSLSLESRSMGLQSLHASQAKGFDFLVCCMRADRVAF